MGRDGAGARWQGYSHQELYDMLHSGPGSAAAGPVAGRWSGLAEALTEIQQQVNAGVTNSGATWTGVAGDTARDALGPLGDWAQQAATAADVMRVSTELQGDLLGKARAAMPAPVAVPQPPTRIGQLVTSQVDYEVAELAGQVAAQQAYQVMAEYETATDDNVDTLGDFGAPPKLVVDTTPITGPVVRAPVTDPDPVGSTAAPRARAAQAPVADDPETAGAAEAAPTERATTGTPREPAAPQPTEHPATARPTNGSANGPTNGSTNGSTGATGTTPRATNGSARTTPAAAEGPAHGGATRPSGFDAADQRTTSLSDRHGTGLSAAEPVAPTPQRHSTEPADTLVSPRFACGAIVPAARRPDDEDEPVDVHESKYLIEADDIYGAQTYSPPVIGEPPRRR